MAGAEVAAGRAVAAGGRGALAGRAAAPPRVGTRAADSPCRTNAGDLQGGQEAQKVCGMMHRSQAGFEPKQGQQGRMLGPARATSQPRLACVVQ